MTATPTPTMLEAPTYGIKERTLQRSGGLRSLIEEAPEGVFIRPRDISVEGEATRAAQTLRDLTRTGVLIKASRGLYYKPFEGEKGPTPELLDAVASSAHARWWPVGGVMAPPDLSVPSPWVPAGLPAASNAAVEQLRLEHKHLATLYYAHHRSAKEIAGKQDLSASTVLRILRQCEVPIRKRGAVPSKLTREIEKTEGAAKIRPFDAYSKGRVTTARIAEMYEVSERTVRRALRQQEVQTKKQRLAEELTKELLERMYIKERQTILQVAMRFRCSEREVRRALERHGIAVRPRGRSVEHKPGLSKEKLTALYKGRGLSQVEIAKRAAVDRHTVRRYLVKYGLLELPEESETL